MKPVFIYLVFASCIINLGCSRKNYTSKTVNKFRSTSGKPDYNDISYWAAHPWKWDPSDSVPRDLQSIYVQDSIVDVFFIHPTTLTSNKDTNKNALIDDEQINTKTDYSSILYQASVFNEQGRVFAPRYRQAHFGNYFTHDTLRAKRSFDLAYEDVKNAFETYLANYNNGRPIVIAAHSQGTTHAARLLKEYFEGKPLQNKLVCAYIVGMPVPEDYFTTLRPCKDSLDTGCFMAWRTFKRGSPGSSFVQKENFRSIVTNPLTWTLDTLYAPDSLNTGGILRNFNKLNPAVVDAQVHENILWVSKPKFFGNFLIKSDNYHIGDINLFYNNIRQNLKTRIGMFWKR
jgi:hypothetical protein